MGVKCLKCGNQVFKRKYPSDHVYDLTRWEVVCITCGTWWLYDIHSKKIICEIDHSMNFYIAVIMFLIAITILIIYSR